MKKLLTLFLLTGIVLFGCSQESDQTDSQTIFESEGIEIESAWARPASEGRISAVYFLISNFESEDDTLISVSSGVAELTEIHESYEQDNDMIGMREVQNVVVPAQSTLNFRPGGLHIMLIQLTQHLQENDEFELTLTFAHAGEINLTVPVRN